VCTLCSSNRRSYSICCETTLCAVECDYSDEKNARFREVERLESGLKNKRKSVESSELPLPLATKVNRCDSFLDQLVNFDLAYM
jgi:hypothetical protein